MSWFGGSISSITGQLSNLTKDILTEGTEEISDPATELRLAKEKIEELQSVLTAQKFESERLKKISKELEEKAESSELQINAISREYRGVLETKEKEVNNLKRQHAELLEQQARSAVRAIRDEGSRSSLSSPHISAPKASSSGFDDGTDGFGSFNYDGDTGDWDFDDSIRLQRENNKLRSDLQNVTAEAKHWRSVAGQLGQKTEKKDDTADNSAKVLELQCNIKDLESQLFKKGEQLQQQATSLHEHHRQKVSTLKEHHAKEAKSLQEKIDVLAQQLSDAGSGSQHSGTLPESDRPNVASREGELERKLAHALSEKEKAQNARVHLEGVLDELQKEVERLQDLNEKQENANQNKNELDLLQKQTGELSHRLEKSEEENEKLKSQLQNACSDSVRDKRKLLDWLDANHADVKGTLDELKELRESWDTEAFYRHDKLRVARRHLVNQMFHVGHKKTEALVSLMRNKEEKDGVVATLEELVSGIGDEELQKKTAELFNVLEKENILLKEQKTKLEEQVILLEKTSSNHMQEKQAMIETMASLQASLPATCDEAVSETDDTLDTNISSRSNSKHPHSAQQVKEEEVDAELLRLRSQLTEMKEESSKFEMDRSDWLMEKEALEDVMVDLQKKSHEQEDEIVSLKSSKATESSNEQDASEQKIQELEREVASLREENVELEKALEELDGQHSEALAQLVNQRHKMAVQIANQGTEIDRYKTEIRSLNQTVEEVKHSGDDEKQEILEKCHYYEQQLVQLEENSKSSDTMEKQIKDLKEKLQKGGLVINDLHMDKQDLEQQLKKAREDIDSKVVKLKDSRTEMTELGKKKMEMENRLKEMEERLLETEVELEKWQQMNEHRQVQVMEKQRGEDVESECSRLRSKLEDMEQEKETIKEEFQFLIAGQKAHGDHDLSGVRDAAFQHIFEEEFKVRQKLEEDDKIISELKEYIEKLRNERQQLKEKVVNMKSESTELTSLLELAKQEKALCAGQVKEKVSDLQRRESELYDLKTEVENVKKEVGRLENTVSSLEGDKLNVEMKLDSREKYYTAFIEELKAGQEAGNERLQALTDMNAEIDKLREQVKDSDALRTSLNQKIKDLEDLMKDNETLQNETTFFKTEHSKLEQLCEKKDEQVKSLKERVTKFEEDLHEMEETLDVTEKEHGDELSKKEKELEALLSVKKDLETRLILLQDELGQNRKSDEQLVRLQMEIEELKKERETSEANMLTISQLESELSLSREKIVGLKEELSHARETIGSTISDAINANEYSLSDKAPQVEIDEKDMSLSIEEKDEMLDAYQSKLDFVLSMLNSSQLDEFNDQFTDMMQSYNTEVMERSVSKPLHSSHSLSQSPDIDDAEEQCNRFAELEKEMEELRGKLSEKDGVITELQRSNSSLLGLLEKKADGDNSLGDRVAVHKLEGELKGLRAEREQMVAVVSEKSRENSSLKSEIHRLMDLVSAGQAALSKSQNDNLNLEQNQREHTPPRDDEDDMKREALNNMARLVRDKDTEIEALTQKNQTLITVLQESGESEAAAHLGPLLKEKETMNQQMALMMSEREQLIACVQQKHSESVAFHAEVQRLTALLVKTQDAADKIRVEYSSFIPAYEGKNQALLSTQQELVECKQKLKEIEIRHGELIQKVNSQQSPPDSPAVDTLEAEVEKYKRLESDYKAMVVERDNQIHNLSQKMKTSEEVASSKEAECTHLRKQLDSSKFQLTGLMAEMAEAKSEWELVQQKSDGQSEQSVTLRNSVNEMTLAVKNKDLEIISLREQVSTLNSVLQSQKGEKDQVAQLIKDQESSVAVSRQLQQERDYNAMVAQQRLQECDALKTDLAAQKDKTFKLGRELDRLRSHLLEIEEGYTNEALEAEEREKELRNKLALAEEQLMSSSSQVQLASQDSHRQIESLQDQLHHIASQRDAAYMQVATTQDQCQQYAASLSNLQLVLEHFQKEKDAAISLETEKYQDQANTFSAKVKDLQFELENTRVDLTEALDGLEAASRLSEQLDRKENALSALKEEVQLREQALKAAEEHISKLTSSTEAKVDKTLMHNMVLTWLTSPEKKRHEIVQLIGHVLDFSTEDFSKIESAHSQDSLWIGFFRRSEPKPSQPSKVDQSFSQLFVKFLEKESSPPPTPVKLPVEEMAAEAQSRYRTNFNPFMAPRHVTHANDTMGSSSASSSHLLMPQDTPHPSPLFAPVTSISNAGESAILKDVLSWKR